MEKTCTRCKLSKPLENFSKRTYRSKTLHQQYCKACMQVYHRIRSYNLTEQLYAELWKKQNGCCAICKHKLKGITEKELVSENLAECAVDHCHDDKVHAGKAEKRKAVRGLLCKTCNSGLGMFHDNVEFLKSAILYLEKAKTQAGHANCTHCPSCQTPKTDS